MAGTQNIRNVALIGHRGAGKTSLVEALAYAVGVTNRMGSTSAGNTIGDFDDEERKRQLTISSVVASFDYAGTRINLIDTPGYADFMGDTYGALRAVDAALLVVHAEQGVEVETERVWEYAAEYHLPVLVVLNHLDGERVELERALGDLERLRARTVAVQVPVGEKAGFEGVVDLVSGEYYPGGQTGSAKRAAPPSAVAEAVAAERAALAEFAAENDEALMEKFFAAGELEPAELTAGLRLGVADRSLVPVTFAAATRNIGMLALLDLIVGLCPTPTERPTVRGVKPRTEQEVERRPVESEPFCAYCFKALHGDGRKVTLMRVLSGAAEAGSTIYNGTQEQKERLGNVGYLLGDQLSEVPRIVAGDIVGAVKLGARTGDTLCDEKEPVVLRPTVYPTPLLSVAVHPKSRGDEEKIGAGVTQLRDEDPSIQYVRNPETGESILSGMGDMHLQVVLAKLSSRHKVEVDTSKPKIAYRETFRAKVESQGRFKKQTGGSGQFGDVYVRVEPLPRGSGFEFADEVFGGRVPGQYIPSVEKGVRARLAEGFVAGFPVVDVKAALYDGSSHPVDSSDLAFQMAGRIAVEACAEKGQVYLLEPICDLWVTVPDDCVGDIMADLPRRRGTVMGSDGSGGRQTVQAQVAAAELATYATDLRSMTQGRGTFRVEFNRYEEVPHEIAQRVIAERAAEQAEQRKS